MLCSIGLCLCKVAWGDMVFGFREPRRRHTRHTVATTLPTTSRPRPFNPIRAKTLGVVIILTFHDCASHIRTLIYVGYRRHIKKPAVHTHTHTAIFLFIHTVLNWITITAWAEWWSSSTLCFVVGLRTLSTSRHATPRDARVGNQADRLPSKSTPRIRVNQWIT